MITFTDKVNRKPLPVEPSYQALIQSTTLTSENDKAAQIFSPNIGKEITNNNKWKYIS